jgi:tRNA-specific 2-thiouridylase
MEREFEEAVLDPFVQAYAAGRTPNPCLNCNQYLKFSTLLDRALAMGVDRLATGHYARVEAANGGYRLYRAADPAKDQSYVLYTLGQSELQRTLFPLGGMTKAETREVARELGLGVAEKPDSVDICFVPGGDYRRLLAAQGHELRPGTVLDAGGREVGRHRGAAAYTVGQRRGLALADAGDGRRRFVTAVDAARNVVVVGEEHELLGSRVEASAPRWVLDAPVAGEGLHARVRYAGALHACHVESIAATGFALTFEESVRAPAPGQAVVLYRLDAARGDEVVGGGTVESSAR